MFWNRLLQMSKLASCAIIFLGVLCTLPCAHAQKDKKDAPVAQLTLTEGKLTVDGEISKDDSKDPVRKNRRFKLYHLKMKKGETYQLDMKSKDLDPFLRVEDDTGKQVAQDDDSGGKLNARIVFTCPANGVYRIFCTTFARAETGSFQLVVQRK